MNLLVKAKERKTGATHTEVTARKGTVRRTKSGKVTTVRATTATVHKKDDLIPIGTPVYFKPEGKPRAFRGSIIGHENGNYHVEGLRQGHQFKADKYLLPKEQVWTHEEHQARKQKPKQAKYESLSSSKRTISVEEQNRRKRVSEQRFDIPENEILTNPAITETMRRTLIGIASTNKITPLVRLNNGFVSSDVPEMNDMISEYTTAMMNSLRLELSQASEEDLKEFKQHLAGEKQNSRILATVTTAGRGAAIRYIKDRNKKLAEMTDFQTVDNDPVMRRELSQHATPAHQEEDLTAKPIHLTVKIIKLLHKLTPLHAQVIKKKFGILRGEPLNNEELAEHLNQAGTPRPDGRKWTRDNVVKTLNSAISEISKQEGVEALRDFYKSLKELVSLKKSGHAGITAQIVKGYKCLIFESETIAKSYSSELIANHPDGRWITVKEGPLHGRHLFILPHKDGSSTVLAGGGPAFRTKEREPQANLGDKLHQELLSGKLSKRDFLKQRKQVKTDLKTAKADLKEGMKSGNGAKIKQAQDAIKEHTEKLGHYENVYKKHDFLTDAQKKQLQWFRDKQTKVLPDYDHFHEALAKVGGIDADEAYRQWGLSIREYPALKQSRILANPLKAKGGLHPDKAAEILAQHGFVATDSHGKHDFRDFEDKLLRAAAGEKIHGNAHIQDESELKEAEERYAREHYGNSENSNLDDLMDFFDSVGVKKSLQRHIATWHRKGKQEVVEDLAKALGYSNKEETTMNLTKSHVRAYTRHSASGAAVQVKEHDDSRRREFDKMHIGYHLTSNKAKIEKEGFKTGKSVGIGGDTSRIYTSDDPKYLEGLADHLNTVRDILNSKQHTKAAVEYCQHNADSMKMVRQMFNLCSKRLGRPLTEKEETAVIAFSGPAMKFAEIKPKFGKELNDFMRGNKFEVVRTRSRNAVSQSEIMGGERAHKEGDVFLDDYHHFTRHHNNPDTPIGEFGAIPEEVATSAGIPAGPIRLMHGRQIDKHRGFGREHIAVQHGKEIREAGYKSEEEFVQDVVKNFNAIYDVGNGRIALTADGKEGQKIHIIEARYSKGQKFYAVVTGYIATKPKFSEQRHKLLWKRVMKALASHLYILKKRMRQWQP